MSERAPRAAPISLRLPERLRGRIMERAIEGGRSFSAEAIALLEVGLEVPVGDGAPVVEPHPVQDAAAGMGDRESPFPPPQLEEIGKPPPEKPFRPDFKAPAKKKEGRRR